MQKLAIIVMVLALAGCTSNDPDRIVCWAGQQQVINYLAPRGVETCYFDIGHRALCYEQAGSRVVISPAFSCVVVEHVELEPPQPTAEPTVQQSPTPVPANDRQPDRQR